MARLGDVCIINPKGKSLDDDCDVSFVPMQSVSEDGTVDVTTIRKYGEVKKGFTNFQDGDILFAKITPCMENGKGCIANGLKNGMGFGSTEFHVLRPKSELVTSEWIYYLTSWPEFRKECEKNMTGSAGQKRVPKTFLENYQIDIPSLDEQDRITAQLDKVSDLIAKRRAQLDKLDLLVKARFVEMFGDVETNPMNWPTSTIGAVVDSIEAGWSGNGTQREKQPGEIAVLKVSAVTKGYFIPSECKVLDDQENIKKYVFPQKGDLLFSRANTREMVGATAVISEDYPELILPDKLWKIRFIDGINVHYMKQVLSSKSVREKFSAASTGTSGSMYNVSMDKFKQIKIPVPPADSQDNFSQFVEQTERMKNYIASSLDKLETMKKALMQEYFG